MRARPSAVLTLALTLVSTEAFAASPGSTYTCQFPTHGVVVIDTREPGATLTVGKRRYPIQSGSYFYQGTNPDDGVEIFFGPNMRWWTYRDERSQRCTRRTNRR